MRAHLLGRRAALGALSAVLLGAAALAAPAAAQTVQMISHRYPALELFAAKMREAVPGVTVNT